jgi:hypothetical protein
MTAPLTRPYAALMLGLGAAALAGAAQAQPVSSEAFTRLESQVQQQAKQITDQQRKIDQLTAENAEMLSAVRAGFAPTSAAPPITRLVQPNSPDVGVQPVGEKPPERPPELAALPPQFNVLTPHGHAVLEPAMEYDRTSADRIVFRGIVIVPGINLGLVEANQAARDMGVASLTGYYGVTDRLEVSARVPYVYRHDTVTTVAAEANQFEQNESIYGDGIGDVEIAGRYQLNSGRDGWPIFLATGRVKTRTGKGPYDVDYDADAVATELPTGSGFTGIEGGVSMIYPTDPAVIFGSLTYLHNISRDVDKTFGTTTGALHVGRVDPGDSIGATLGFGLSLNQRFSVSFGYEHNYVFATEAREGSPGATPLTARFRPLQAGSLLLGGSFRVSNKLMLNTAVEVGMTSDAPDLQLTVRAPYRF